MSENPRSLHPKLANDPTVQPPYSNTQISDTAMHRETLHIYRNSRPETRAVYECGYYVEGGVEENWIIKWLLWHVFRYRDNRNRARSIPAWVARDQRASIASNSSGASIGESTEQGSNCKAALFP